MGCPGKGRKCGKAGQGRKAAQVRQGRQGEFAGESGHGQPLAATASPSRQPASGLHYYYDTDWRMLEVQVDTDGDCTAADQRPQIWAKRGRIGPGYTGSSTTIDPLVMRDIVRAGGHGIGSASLPGSVSTRCDRSAQVLGYVKTFVAPVRR